MTLTSGGCVDERAKPGDDEIRCGGGGGVAGARGMTLGEAATDDTGADGARCGAGGGGDRRPPDVAAPGPIPRDEGGGGMRDVGPGVTPPMGLGGMLTGLGTTLTGAEGATGGVVSEAVEALGSLSSPIESLAAQASHRAD